MMLTIEITDSILTINLDSKDIGLFKKLPNRLSPSAGILSLLRKRSYHTGTQPISTITGLQEALDEMQAVIEALGSEDSSGSSGSSAVALAAHTAAADPHSQYALKTTLGTAAYQPADAFATAIQGALATTALQSIPDIDASKITSGTLAESRIPASIARDSEVVAAISDAISGEGGGSGTYQPLSSGLSAIALLPTAEYGRSLLTATNPVAAGATLMLGTAAYQPIAAFATATQGALATTALQSIPDIDASKITSGTLPESRIPASIARDSEVTASISALSSLYQPIDDGLTAIAALDTTSFGRSFLTMADATAGRLLLNVSGSPLPTGTVDQTLRHDGVNFVATSAVKVSASGDIAASATGSSDSTPRIVGISDLAKNTSAAFQFGDSFNQLLTIWGRGVLLKSYHGVVLHGGHAGNPAALPLGDAQNDPSLTVLGTGVGPALRISTGLNASQVNAVEVLDNSSVIAAAIDKAGNITAKSFKISNLNTPPASAVDTGTTGEIRFTGDCIYVCVATNVWKRSPLAAW